MRILELHFAVSVIQRSRGRSSVAASAYISGQCLIDRRTGLIHDYSHRRDVEATGIALSCGAPDWAHDRETLFSNTELREKHPRAQTARSFVINLPREFSAEHRREAALKISHLLAERGRTAVDWALHPPSEDGDHRNNHLHCISTTRAFEDGKWAATKDRTLDDRYGKGPAEIKLLRMHVAGILTDIAIREKLPIYIEYLSFQDRLLEKEPMKHLGPVNTALERKGRPTVAGNENRAIQARNEERQALQEQTNVINIEAARELQRNKRGLPLPHQWDEAYKQLYRDSANRRAAIIEQLEREHGERERTARAEAARLELEASNANIIARWWRVLSGRTDEDRLQIQQFREELESLARLRAKAIAAFEEDRRSRFERFHLERLAYEEALKQSLREAVGYERTSGAPSAAATPRSAPGDLVNGTAVHRKATGAPGENASVGGTDYVARVRTRGMAPPALASNPVELKNAQPKPTLGIPGSKARPDYEGRRDAYFALIRMKRSRHSRLEPEATRVNSSDAQLKEPEQVEPMAEQQLDHAEWPELEIE